MHLQLSVACFSDISFCPAATQGKHEGQDPEQTQHVSISGLHCCWDLVGCFCSDSEDCVCGVTGAGLTAANGTAAAPAKPHATAAAAKVETARTAVAGFVNGRHPHLAVPTTDVSNQYARLALDEAWGSDSD